MGRVVSIHQPNYLPWAGYFHKIASSDVFVFLNNVQYSKNSYQNRVQICLNREAFWLTQPVKTKGLFKAYTNEIRFVDESWMQKHAKTLIQCYGKHPRFKDIEPLMEMYGEPAENMSEFNIRAVRLLCRILNIGTETLVASDFNLPEFADATERLVNITLRAGGTVYLSGSGGRSYHNEELFKQANVDVVYSGFEQIPYSQMNCSRFVPGLSIIDLICNLGAEGAARIVKREQ